MSRFLPKRLDGIFAKKNAPREHEIILPLTEKPPEPTLVEPSFEKTEKSFTAGKIAADETAVQEQGVIITDPLTSFPSAPYVKKDNSRPARGIFLKWLKKLSPYKKASVAVGSAASPLAQEIQNHRRFRLIGWGITLGIMVVVALAVVLSTAFASLTVTVKPHTDIHAVPDITLTLDSAASRASAGQRVIPAERLEFTQRAEKQFSSSGKEHVEDPARGMTRIYNKYSSSAQPLIATTRFAAESGMIYRLTKSVTIPGAKIEEGKIVPQFIETELAADKPGEQANASGEVTLRIPGFKGSAKYEGFYAVAASGFSGGFVGEARVVTRDDLKGAQEKVTKEVYDALKNEALGKIPPDFEFLDALREIEITKVDSPQEKTRAAEFTVRTEATSRVVVFRESDVLRMLHEIVLKNDSAKEIMAGDIRLEYQVRSVDFTKGKATLSLKGNIKSKNKITAGELKTLLKGKKEGSIIELLKKRPDLASFRLTFFPFWLSRAPDDESRIKLQTLDP